MAVFNPFSKPIEDLEAQDLATLREVSEGWHVEYKQELSDKRTIGKTVSSFANQGGGWAFYGIVEDSERRTAESFPGIPALNLGRILDSCRDGIAAHVTPVPHFDYKFLAGPCEEIGLPAEFGILALWVPEGNNPAYVHSSGRIYQRTGDSSKPLPITDRHSLDKLAEKSRVARERLRRKITRVPARSRPEDDQTYLHLHFMSDPLGDRGHKSRMTLERFASLVTSGKDIPFFIPFDNVFPGPGALVARMTHLNQPQLLLPTWEYSRDCSSTVTFPMNSNVADPLTMRAMLAGYDHLDDFCELLEADDYSACRVVDLNFLGAVLHFATMQHRRLAASDAVFGPFRCKAHIEGMWRRIPYLDLSCFIDQAANYGLPVLQQESALAPPDTSLDSMIEIPQRLEDFESTERAIVDSLGLFMAALNALGVSISVLIDSKGEFLELVERANKSQELRRRAGYG